MFDIHPRRLNDFGERMRCGSFSSGPSLSLFSSVCQAQNCRPYILPIFPRVGHCSPIFLSGKWHDRVRPGREIIAYGGTSSPLSLWRFPPT
jgi:hypothetical protein